MIPKNINRHDILRAIREIDKKGVPKGRESRKFQLSHSGKYYPPKYVVSLANKYANSVELDSSEFGGGQETNSFLRKLGFEVIESSPSGVFVKSAQREVKKRKEPRHDERCRECKNTIERMLKKIYGMVEVNYKFETSTKPKDYRNALLYPRLKEIFSELQSHRGHKDFVRSQTLPRCDFFVPNPGFIVEFDESQHFTACRRLTLSKYPDNLQLRFDKEGWIKLCDQTNAKDNDPPYRDEQRAWYDTLRDFLPELKGLGPTVRLYSKGMQWCSLSPGNPSDVERFRAIIERRSQKWTIEIKEDPEPSLARVIIAGKWDGDIQIARKLLEEIYEEIYKKWPKGRKFKCIMTCGGFVQFEWPENISRREIGDNKNPNRRIVDVLVKEAKQTAKLVLSNGLDRKLKKVTDYITLGIDSHIDKENLKKPHIELVALIDLKRDEWKLDWTGKSYPHKEQEDGLVYINDLGTHFVNLNGEKTMILGCHDLYLLINRGKRTKRETWRKSIRKDFQDLAVKERPICVLQHPHTTDSVKIWDAAWGASKTLLPPVKRYASAGRYYNDGEPERSSLKEVLEKTKCGNTLDFVARFTEQ